MQLDVLVVRAREGVVRRGPALRVLVVLEERRVHDPEEVPLAAVPYSGMSPSFLARCTRRFAITVCTSDSLPNWKQDQVARPWRRAPR